MAEMLGFKEKGEVEERPDWFYFFVFFAFFFPFFLAILLRSYSYS
jgi:hypothetical protein